MGDRADPPMTVHLLTNSGRSLLLQQTLDRLLQWICPDIHLFLVSERLTPLKYSERYCKRSCGFPGISVLLFLHEDLGEERIFQVHEQFQCPPWRYKCAQIAKRQNHPYTPAHQDFYSLDDHMPVWGIRRVRRGPEILRVTLYCTFDNYEDAARLYEMILQKEAAVQKSNFCAFVLYAARNVAVQLCLEQLPVGVAAELKESSALQFKVRDMGQLVPLLPNPCVPISSARWQTQDYDGNTILLQVQDSSKPCGTNVGLSHQHNIAGSEKILQDSVPAPLPVKWGNPGWRIQEVTATKGKTKPDQSKALCPEKAGGDHHRHFCSSHGAPAARLWWSETNVDTGLAVVSPGSSHRLLNHISRGLRAPTDGAGTTRSSQDRTQLPPAAATRNKGAGQRPSRTRLQTPWASPASRAEDKEEEEFFI